MSSFLLNANHKKAVCFILIAMLMLTIKDAADKILVGQNYHVMELIWFRFALPFLCVFLICSRKTISSIKKCTLKVLLRSLSFCFVAYFSVVSLKLLPLNQYIIINQFGPVLMSILGVLWFKEICTTAKMIAVSVGFLGVIITINPWNDFDSHEMLYYIAPLIVLLGSTFHNLITKTIEPHLSVFDIFICTLFFISLLPTCYFILYPSDWMNPTPNNFHLFLTVAITTVIAQWCLIKGMQLSEASKIAPVFYTQIIMGICLGIIIFNEVLTFEALLGATLIVLSNFIIQNKKRGKSKPDS